MYKITKIQKAYSNGYTLLLHSLEDGSYKHISLKKSFSLKVGMNIELNDKNEYFVPLNSVEDKINFIKAISNYGVDKTNIDEVWKKLENKKLKNKYFEEIINRPNLIKSKFKDASMVKQYITDILVDNDIVKPFYENPYILLKYGVRLDEIKSISEILNIVVKPNDYKYACMYSAFLRNSKTSVSLEILNKKQSDYVFTDEDIKDAINNSIYDFVLDKDGLLTTKTTIEKIKTLMERVKNNKTTDKDYRKLIEQHSNILSGEQIDVIGSVLNNNFSIISGGAGVGKTTCLSCILDVLLYDLGYKSSEICLLAPTGKASVRMSEVLNFKVNASTIHSRLRPIDENMRKFYFNEDNKLSSRVVICDEAGMNDLNLMYSLFIAIKKEAKIILLGDVEQLQPVGFGNPFHYLIENGCKTFYLTQVMRQNEHSGIFQISNKIRNDGTDREIVNEINKQYNDFRFTNIKLDEMGLNTNNYYDRFLDYIAGQYIKGMERFGNEDVSILCSTNKDKLLGTIKINNYIQDKLLSMGKLNKDRYVYNEATETMFYEHDKVINCRNTKKYNLLNGEIGTIMGITLSEVIVNVNGESKAIDKKYFFENFKLGYALSIHKSQGSEFKKIIMVLDGSHLENKSLIYTGITRARSECLVCSNSETFIKALHRKSVEKKNRT